MDVCVGNAQVIGNLIDCIRINFCGNQHVCQYEKHQVANAFVISQIYGFNPCHYPVHFLLNGPQGFG